MFSALTKLNLQLNLFAFAKVPLVWACRPKILHVDSQRISLKIPLKRNTKNHLNSMYFGALAVGADTVGGFYALSKAKDNGCKISMAFKSVAGQFLKRPEADVIFTCEDGELIDQMIAQSLQSGTRVNEVIEVVATCPSLHGDEAMANFQLTLSIKVIG
jgi:hypothetical protein